MGKCKIANILEMANRRAKQNEIWDSGSLGGICATSWTLANGQVSCPNMAILKTDLYLRNYLPIEQKQAQFQPPRVERDLYVQLLDLLSVTKFHAQIYGNFENWPIS